MRLPCLSYPICQLHLPHALAWNIDQNKMGAGVKEEMGAVSEMNLPEEMRNVVLGQAHYYQESCVLIFEKLLIILCIVSVIL